MKNYAMKLHNDLKGKLLPNFMNFANECSNMLQENGFKNSPVKRNVQEMTVYQPKYIILFQNPSKHKRFSHK